MKKGVKIVVALIAMSILTASSVMLVTSACITGESWWPLLALSLAVLAPFPVLLFGGVGDGSSWQDDDDDKEQDVAWLLSSVLATSSISMSLVLAKNAIVSIRSTWMSIMGTWCAAVTVAIFSVMVSKGHRAGEMF